MHLEIKDGIETGSDGGRLTSTGNEAVQLILAANIQPKEIMKGKGTNRRYSSRGLTRNGLSIYTCL